MFSTARSILALASALVVLAPSASAFDSPLSDTAVRSAYPTVKLPPNDYLRRSWFWKDFEFRVFDDQSKRAPANISGKGDFNCDDGRNGRLIGSAVTLEFSPTAFSSQRATIEVTGPDGQIVHAGFDLASFR
jgi:hypothetical protein